MQPNRKKFYDTGVNEMKYSDYISDEKIMELYKLDKQKGNKVAIEKYEKYVYKIISKIKNSYMFLHEMEDLHQAGCEGIMKALVGYDSNKGKFYNYCHNFVKKEIVGQFRFFLGESSEYYARLHRDILKVRDEVIEEHGMVSIDEIMKRTGKSRKIVVRELQVDYTRVSYEALVDGQIC